MGYRGGFSGGTEFRAGGYFSGNLWKFRVRPSRVFVAGRGVLNLRVCAFLCVDGLGGFSYRHKCWLTKVREHACPKIRPSKNSPYVFEYANPPQSPRRESPAVVFILGFGGRDGFPR